MSEETSVETSPQARARRWRRPRTRLGWFVAALSALVLLVVAAAVVTRYGVLTTPGRVLIEARGDGLKLGRIGTLGIEGLSGDIWSDFGIRRLTISDEKGVWLEARNLGVVWRAGELLHRRVHVEAVVAEQIRVLRRPMLTPKGIERETPLSFAIDSLKSRVILEPEFSTRRGDFDLIAEFEAVRRGGTRGKVQASSRLHAGDGLTADFDLGQSERMRFNVDAHEAQGGALAGALGLRPDQPFVLTARADGTRRQGALNALARSGQITPLKAQGRWTPEGMQGEADILLSASKLMEGNVRRFGPALRLAVEGAGKGDDLYDVRLDARAENLILNAVGPINTAARATSGLRVDVAVAELNRLTAFPRMGGGRLVGTLSGTTADWTAEGDLTGRGLNFAGYTLASATGPATISRRRGELNIKANLSGAGGAGRTILATWMGAQPQASVSLTRFPDRRILVRDLNGRGAGFTLKGKGSRGVFGGFDFDGEVQISNLAAARKGASGVLVGRWTATKGRPQTPWRFRFDGRGTDFSSGFAQLDRLLGRTPRLKGEAAYADARWTFANLDVDGAQAALQARGVLERGMVLDFAYDWRANGPFQAGPVEVAGDVKGQGTLKGPLETPRADLTAAIEAIDFPKLTVSPARLALTFARLPSGGHGAIRLTGNSAYGEALARADFRFMDEGLDLSNIDARAGGVTAAGRLALRGREPSRADLVLSAEAGAFLASGRADAKVVIVDGAGGAQANMRLTAENVRFRDSDVAVRSLDLTANGPMSRLPYTVEGDLSLPQAPIRFGGRGVAAEAGQGWQVTFEGAGQAARADLKTITPLVLNFGGSETRANGALAVGNGRADFQARQSKEDVAFMARVQNVDLNVASEDLAGRISGVLALNGRGPRLSGSLDANLVDARSRDGPAELAITGAVTGRLEDTRLTLNASVNNERGLKSTVNLVLPAETSAAPLRIALNRTRPIQGRFDLDGELAPVWDLFFGGSRSLAGHLTAAGALGGTLNDPRLTGQASLENGSFEDEATGLRLTGVTVGAQMNEDEVQVGRFSGADGRGGTVSGSGRVSLERGGSSTFTLNATRFHLIDNDLGQAQASGAVTVTRGSDGRAKLAGRLTIDRADLVAEPPTPSGVTPMDVVEINRPEMREDSFRPPTSRAPAVALDVTLTAPRRVFVRGRGLDVELSLDAHVGGTTARPELDGVARVVRGDYQFASKRFEFDERSVIYLASTTERIRLDLSATREDPSLTAVVNIAGTAAKPEISLTSIPALPNDEVLSQVLFGRSASQLSPVEAAQLASALSGLASGGGLDVIGNLRSFARLDRLAFAGGDASGLAVSGGKYITDDVYLELTGGGRDGPVAQVEWRVRRTLSIVSRLAGTGDSRLSVRWRRDYGRPAR